VFESCQTSHLFASLWRICRSNFLHTEVGVVSGYLNSATIIVRSLESLSNAGNKGSRFCCCPAEHRLGAKLYLLRTSPGSRLTTQQHLVPRAASRCGPRTLRVPSHNSLRLCVVPVDQIAGVDYDIYGSRFSAQSRDRVFPLWYSGPICPDTSQDCSSVLRRRIITGPNCIRLPSSTLSLYTPLLATSSCSLVSFPTSLHLHPLNNFFFHHIFPLESEWRAVGEVASPSSHPCRRAPAKSFFDRFLVHFPTIRTIKMISYRCKTLTALMPTPQKRKSTSGGWHRRSRRCKTTTQLKLGSSVSLGEISLSR
jgi:hypothetical protein